MFGVGGFELFLIVFFAFLVFGPDKLPVLAKTVGRAIAKFKSAQEDMKDSLKDSVQASETDTSSEGKTGV